MTAAAKVDPEVFSPLHDLFVEQAGARKDDQQKLRYDLIPELPLRYLAQVYTIGATKYGDNNWTLGMKWSRLHGALMRHLEAWRRGEAIDPTDGQHHLASVAWCAFSLMEYEETHPELNDVGRAHA